jgi:hypothetical protein
MAAVHSPSKHALDHQFERIGWALFLIMLGGLWLLPTVPDGTWLVGTGVILLGLNAARAQNGIPTSSFTILLGSAAIILGIAEFVGAGLPVFPILLIVIGASILWRAGAGVLTGC